LCLLCLGLPRSSQVSRLHLKIRAEFVCPVLASALTTRLQLTHCNSSESHQFTSSLFRRRRCSIPHPLADSLAHESITMAILPTHPGLTVQITVDGKQLPEYTDDDAPNESNTITKYIEAQPGSEFAIKYTFDKTFPTKNDVGIDAFIDGTLLSSPIIKKHRLLSRSRKILGFMTNANDKWMLQKWTFQKLSICDS
jgi:hypothetical protein